MAAVTTLSFKPAIMCSSNSSSSSSNSKPCFDLKKRITNVGVGLLASSVMALTPLDADATRIEYYATTADPPCDFNFVRSGLGYCDLDVGSGEEAPYAQLINVTCIKFSTLGF